eukprot:CAMPEP_0173442992 /NCGR_PEP_ID=MMETSP1357-20121228/28692_1 /TAXON_ID=77926 /ORGANISM="Hemiselmis rufescens, Strain PCC563" /LENGTH=46 /DNA_ID= /DNA_START= /DNA_END= /DNA_ORIENTATION=
MAPMSSRTFPNAPTRMLLLAAGVAKLHVAAVALDRLDLCKLEDLQL